MRYHSHSITPLKIPTLSSSSQVERFPNRSKSKDSSINREKNIPMKWEGRKMLIAFTKIILTMFLQIIWPTDKCQNHTHLAKEKKMSNKVKCTFPNSLRACSGNHRVMYQTGRVFVKAILVLFLAVPSPSSTKRESFYRTLVQTPPFSKGNLYPCFEVQKEKTLRLWSVSDSLSFIPYKQKL
jgi:hypothetical protein